MQPWRFPSVALALFVAVHAAPAEAASDVVVEAERQGEGIEVRARASVAAPRELVWEVLTDYASLPRFIPGLSRSAVKAREPGRVLVDQAGEARFLFFSFPIEAQLEVVEAPPARITSRSVGGNLRRLHGRYDIEVDAARGGCTLRYQGLIEPAFDLPPLIGVAAMRGMVQEQFTAMVAEIERRAAAASR